jgi:hypothetical protein
LFFGVDAADKVDRGRAADVAAAVKIVRPVGGGVADV